MSLKNILGWGFIIVVGGLALAGKSNKPQSLEEPVAVLSDAEKKDAQDFAQSLVQAKGYKCDTVSMFTSNSYTGNADILCDDLHRYRITKPGGRWKVETL